MVRPTNSELNATQSALDQLKAALRPARLTPEDSLLVACSGGADSMALAVLLQLAWPDEAGPRLVLAHFNHHLREEAARDEAFVAAYAARQGLQFRSGEASPEQISRRSETQARANRYNWLEGCRAELQSRSEGKVWLVTAHQRDDQAETVLMNLCRGTGLRGLGGMEPLDADRGLARPLLGIDAITLRTVLREQGESWVEDETNAVEDNWRNQLRHEVLPRLDRIFDRDSSLAIARAAELVRQDEAYLQARAEETGRTLSGRVYGSPLTDQREQGRADHKLLLYRLIDGPALQKLESALSSRLIRVWTGELSGLNWPKDMSAADLEVILSILRGGRGADAPGGLRLEPLGTGNGHWSWRMWNPQTLAAFDGTVCADGRSLVVLPAGCEVSINCGAADQQAGAGQDDELWYYRDREWRQGGILRSRRPGDRLAFSTDGRVWHKQLKQWQAEQGIWPELRERMAVLGVGSEIIAIPRTIDGLVQLNPAIINEIRADATV